MCRLEAGNEKFTVYDALCTCNFKNQVSALSLPWDLNGILASVCRCQQIVMGSLSSAMAYRYFIINM
jgi:hypothetical protein